MKNLTWQNPEQLFVAQELINKVKSKCCGIKVLYRGSFGHELLKTKDDLYLSNVIGKAILLDEIKSRKETIKFLKDEKNKYPEDKELKEFVKEVYEYGPLGESHFYEEY